MRNTESRIRQTRTLVLTLVLLSFIGCASNEQHTAWKWPETRSQRSGDTAIESNIVRVNKFFSQNPWLSFDSDGSKTVDGVSCTVYLEGPKEPKGVFGTGTILVSMYRLDLDPLGRENAVPIHEWAMTSQEAYPWRAKERTALGWGYGLRLQWPRGLDVAGKQVAFVIKYVREDGRIIGSSRQVLKVPVAGAPATQVS